MVEIEGKLLMEALNLLQEYAYESERDGDVWKSREVTLCANKVRTVLFHSPKETDENWTKRFVERVRAGEKAFWSEETNEAFKKMLSEKSEEEKTEADRNLEYTVKEMDKIYKKWRKEENENEE